jgi:hypothetical protein
LFQLLDHATHRLNLIDSARKFYLVDGTIVSSIDDILQWANNYYTKRYYHITKTTLLDKVELNTPLPPKSKQERNEILTRTTIDSIHSLGYDSRRGSHLDNLTEKAMLHVKPINKYRSKQHFQLLPNSSDIKRAFKQNSFTRMLEIDLNYLLKFPIEVWASSGESFINLSGISHTANCMLY